MAENGTIEVVVRDFLMTEVLQEGADSDELADTTELVQSGLLDSISVLGLVDFIEEEFDIILEVEDIRDFKSIVQIAEIVRSKVS